MTTRETRGCVRCFGFGRYAHAERADERPVVIPCPTCGGAGVVSVLIYEPRAPKRDRRRA
jgi:hypothetical protein